MQQLHVPSPPTNQGIIWDEVPMQHKYDIDAVDQCLRDLLKVSNHLHLIALELTQNNHSFGGITIVFGGDFHQTLPVVPKGVKLK